MIREFAIDPEVFSNFQNFRLLSDKFSVFNGRVISAFPKNWVARAVAALGKMPDGLRKSEIMAWLSPSPDRKHIFVKSGRAYDSEKLWLDNAVACEKKFFLILTAEAGDYVDREDILLIDENTALQNCEKFRIETSVLMPRTIDGFRATAGPLIKFSKTIIFVDPYFCASVSNRRAFGENLRSLLGLIDPGASVKVCAGSMRERMDPAYRSEELEKFVPQFIPPGIKLSVVLLDKAPGADTHNRYIITELGGLNFSCGLEINESGSPDMVALMSENVWKQKFYEFDTLANHRIYDTLIFDKSGRGF